MFDAVCAILITVSILWTLAAVIHNARPGDPLYEVFAGMGYAFGKIWAVIHGGLGWFWDTPRRTPFYDVQAIARLEEECPDSTQALIDRIDRELQATEAWGRTQDRAERWFGHERVARDPHEWRRGPDWIDRQC